MQPPAHIRVLVVDDEEAPRRTTARALRKARYEVSEAGNGHQALDIIEQSEPFDLYVLDVTMPVMRGTELAERIRRRQPDARILYFTGNSDALFESGREVLAGSEAFIEKPASLKDVLEAASLLLFGHVRGPGLTESDAHSDEVT